MFPEDDGTTEGNEDRRPYATLVAACVLAAGKLGIELLSRTVRGARVTRAALVTAGSE